MVAVVCCAILLATDNDNFRFFFFLRCAGLAWRRLDRAARLIMGFNASFVRFTALINFNAVSKSDTVSMRSAGEGNVRSIAFCCA